VTRVASGKSGRTPPAGRRELCARAVDRLAAAVAERGGPAAERIDGVTSLAAARAVRQAAAT
jgi:hypothetical protein